MENYYPDETIMLVKRQKVTSERRNKDSDKPKDEAIEEVFWDQAHRR